MKPFDYITQIFLVIVIFLIGCIIGKVVEKTVKRVLHELELNMLLKRVVGAKVLLEEACSIIAKWLVYATTLIIALKQLGIETLALNLFIGGIVLFTLIALLLALRDAIPNAVAGLLIFRRNAIRKGDLVRVKDVEGMVHDVSLLQTVIETKNGDMMYIPNAALVKERFWKKRK